MSIPLATKVTKVARGKTPYLFEFSVFFVAMKTYPHLRYGRRTPPTRNLKPETLNFLLYTFYMFYTA